MIRPGDESYFINSMEPESLPNSGGTWAIAQSNINLMAIVDPNDFYYHYKGSINYPECEEDILWYVFEEEQWVSVKQMDYFKALLFNEETQLGNIRNI
jgi:carbonic anhydrase